MEPSGEARIHKVHFGARTNSTSQSTPPRRQPVNEKSSLQKLRITLGGRLFNTRLPRGFCDGEKPACLGGKLAEESRQSLPLAHPREVHDVPFDNKGNVVVKPTVPRSCRWTPQRKRHPATDDSFCVLLP